MLATLITPRVSRRPRRRPNRPPSRLSDVPPKPARTLLRRFRRSRRARQGRRRQIESIKDWNAPHGRTTPEIATILLQMKRPTDTLVENECADLNLDETAAKAALAQLQSSLRRKPWERQVQPDDARGRAVDAETLIVR